MKQNSCTPINPKKYACYGLKNIHARNLITKKNSCGSKIPLPPHNFSNGPSFTINTFPSRLSLGVTAPKGVIQRNVPNTQHNIFCTKQAQQDKNRTSWLTVWSVKFRLICFLRCVSWRWGFILTLKFSIRVAFCRKTEKSAKTLSLTVRNRILILEAGLKLKSPGLFLQDRLWTTLLSAAFLERTAEPRAFLSVAQRKTAIIDV